MDALALFTSLDGRLSRRAFWLSLLVIYAGGLAAQFLLTPQVLAQSGIWPFCAVQAALIWAWLVIHIKRLRDAGQGGATAIAVSVIYALAIALLMVLIAFLTNPNVSGAPPAGSQTPADAAGNAWLGIFLVFAIFGVLFSHDFGMFMVILKLMIFLACLPLLISMAFSLITGLRKSVGVSAAP